MLEVLDRAIRQLQAVKGIKIGKEVKELLFVDDMIACMSDPKISTAKTLTTDKELLESRCIDNELKDSIPALYK